MFEQCGRCVGIRGLGKSVGRSFLSPQFLACGSIERDNIGRVIRPEPVKHFNNKCPIVKQRGRGISPIETKSAVIILKVSLPDLVPFHIESSYSTVAGDDPNMLSIGYWRRR